MSLAPLEDLIASLAVNVEIAEAAAVKAEPKLKAQLLDTISAGTAPDGTPWAKTKRGGKVPLKNAASAVQVTTNGDRVLYAVRGHHALHDQGRAKGGVKRPIIPKGVSEEQAVILREAVMAAAKEHFGG